MLIELYTIKFYNMKNYKIILIISLLLVITFFLEKTNFENTSASFSFISYNSESNHSFSILLHDDVKPNSKIYFTNSKWNGTRFGIKGGDLIWNTGAQIIKKGTIINFRFLNTDVQTNFGKIKGKINLNKSGDAVFAYLGDGIKMPTKFICAVAADSTNYGTLVNTNLKHGVSVISYPRNTIHAQLKSNILPDIKTIYQIENYNFKSNIKSLSNLVVN